MNLIYLTVGLLCLFSVSLSKPAPNVFEFSQKDFLKKIIRGETKGKPASPAQDSVCGYKGCDLGKPGVLNVHIVPHTHDDVGWLKTVDQYYYGSQNQIQHAGVQYILDSVVEELQKNPDRRFIYVEIAYFYRWWNQQDDATRHIIKGLVNEGRLEFILGGWCMNDEASTHYNAIIDQHTRGFKFIKDNFGDCGRPRIGWQIDPFGHSREQASLFAQFGFDALFFGRLDFEDKENRLKEKTMELVWMGSDNLGMQASLFTGVNYNGYSPPAAFCYDEGCSDPPIMDDDRLNDDNVDDTVQIFIKAAMDQAEHYTTNHIMMTMGSDFQYQNAHENYKNYDKLIKYVNEFAIKNKTAINLLYSTPSCYAYAINQERQTYTTKQDDFFPYASRGHTFWTGYFTSRPALKGYARKANNFLQVCKQMSVLAKLGPETGSEYKMDFLRRGLGVSQHHDAISGTEKQAVAYDYAQRIARGIQYCQEVIQDAFKNLLPLKSSVPTPPTQQFCQLLNATSCPGSEDYAQFTVTVYNPIARPVNKWVSIPVTGMYEVLGPDMSPVDAQLIPLSPETMKLPEHKGSPAQASLVFKAANLPPLGFATYFVRQSKNTAHLDISREEKMVGQTTIENEHLSLSFDESTGLLSGITNKVMGVSAHVTQSLMYYNAMAGDNSKDVKQASGAYCFRPNGTDPIQISGSPNTTVVKGPQVQEIRQVYSDWASQVYRLYSGEQHVEVEWTVGPIPIDDKLGKEVIARFSSDLDNGDEFFTDANGREVLKRVRDYRPTWKLNQTEPVAGNYYPVNSRIYIQDRTQGMQLTVLNDRSQGGASIKSGQLELMVHRRLLYDDSFGVGEPLNETGITGKGLVVRGKFYVFLEPLSAGQHSQRNLGEHIFMAPSLTFSQLSGTPQQYASMYHTTWSGMATALPDNVHLLTLEEWDAGSVLLRLEHFYEKTDDPVLSRPVTVNLQNIFSSAYNVTSAEELILGANAKVMDVTRLTWNTKLGQTDASMAAGVTPFDAASMDVTLNPMQIRTFQISLS